MSRVEIVDLTIDVPGRRLFAAAGFAVEPGECVAVLGSSGAGKTSLLNAIAGLMAPAAGTVRIGDTTISALSAGKRSAFRLRHVGIVFQFGELMPELSLEENVSLPLRFLGTARGDARARARTYLERMSLADRADQHPGEVSGGEVQRAALARALVHGPSVVLADEPTGMLDGENTRLVANQLAQSASDLGVSVVVATHDAVVADVADRVLRINDGQIDTAGDRADLGSVR